MQERQLFLDKSRVESKKHWDMLYELLTMETLTDNIWWLRAVVIKYPNKRQLHHYYDLGLYVEKGKLKLYYISGYTNEDIASELYIPLESEDVSRYDEIFEMTNGRIVTDFDLFQNISSFFTAYTNSQDTNSYVGNLTKHWNCWEFEFPSLKSLFTYKFPESLTDIILVSQENL